MSENTPDTTEYDEKIKYGEDDIREKTEATVGKLSDQAKDGGDAGRPEQDTDGDPASDPA